MQSFMPIRFQYIFNIIICALIYVYSKKSNLIKSSNRFLSGANELEVNELTMQKIYTSNRLLTKSSISHKYALKKCL